MTTKECIEPFANTAFETKEPLDVEGLQKSWRDSTGEGLDVRVFYPETREGFKKPRSKFRFVREDDFITGYNTIVEVWIAPYLEK